MDNLGGMGVTGLLYAKNRGLSGKFTLDMNKKRGNTHSVGFISPTPQEIIRNRLFLDDYFSRIITSCDKKINNRFLSKMTAFGRKGGSYAF